MSETDGIEEGMSAELRIILTAAAQAGEMMQRSREQRRREQAARDQEEARALESRLAAEQKAAVASLTRVEDERWWNQARPDEVAEMYRQARAWSSEDPRAVQAQQRIESEVERRYGVELTSSMEPDVAAESLRRAQRDQEERRDREAEQAVEAEKRAEEHESESQRSAETGDLAGAEKREQEAAAERDLSDSHWDSKDRHDKLAEQLRDRGVTEEAVQSRLHTRMAQGVDPADSVRGSDGRIPAKAKVHALQRERGPLTK